MISSRWKRESGIVRCLEFVDREETDDGDDMGEEHGCLLGLETSDDWLVGEDMADEGRDARQD